MNQRKRKEKLNLIYLISHPDGLRSRYTVFSRSKGPKGLVGDKLLTGVVYGVGCIPREEGEIEDYRKALLELKWGGCLSTNVAHKSFFMRGRSYVILEQNLIEECNEENADLIQVEREGLINSAAQYHQNLYGEQFRDIMIEMGSIFREKIKSKCPHLYPISLRGGE